MGEENNSNKIVQSDNKILQCSNKIGQLPWSIELKKHNCLNIQCCNRKLNNCLNENCECKYYRQCIELTSESAVSFMQEQISDFQTQMFKQFKKSINKLSSKFNIALLCLQRKKIFQDQSCRVLDDNFQHIRLNVENTILEESNNISKSLINIFQSFITNTDYLVNKSHEDKKLAQNSKEYQQSEDIQQIQQQSRQIVQQKHLQVNQKLKVIQSLIQNQDIQHPDNEIETFSRSSIKVQQKLSRNLTSGTSAQIQLEQSRLFVKDLTCQHIEKLQPYCLSESFAFNSKLSDFQNALINILNHKVIINDSDYFVRPSKISQWGKQKIDKYLSVADKPQSVEEWGRLCLVSEISKTQKQQCWYLEITQDGRYVWKSNRVVDLVDFKILLKFITGESQVSKKCPSVVINTGSNTDLKFQDAYQAKDPDLIDQDLFQRMKQLTHDLLKEINKQKLNSLLNKKNINKKIYFNRICINTGSIYPKIANHIIDTQPYKAYSKVKAEHLQQYGENHFEKDLMFLHFPEQQSQIAQLFQISSEMKISDQQQQRFRLNRYQKTQLINTLLNKHDIILGQRKDDNEPILRLIEACYQTLQQFEHFKWSAKLSGVETLLNTQKVIDLLIENEKGFKQGAQFSKSLLKSKKMLKTVIDNKLKTRQINIKRQNQTIYQLEDQLEEQLKQILNEKILNKNSNDVAAKMLLMELIGIYQKQFPTRFRLTQKSFSTEDSQRMQSESFDSSQTFVITSAQLKNIQQVFRQFYKNTNQHNNQFKSEEKDQKQSSIQVIIRTLIDQYNSKQNLDQSLKLNEEQILLTLQLVQSQFFKKNTVGQYTKSSQGFAEIMNAQMITVKSLSKIINALETIITQLKPSQGGITGSVLDSIVTALKAWWNKNDNKQAKFISQTNAQKKQEKQCCKNCKLCQKNKPFNQYKSDEDKSESGKSHKESNCCQKCQSPNHCTQTHICQYCKQNKTAQLQQGDKVKKKVKKY